MLIAASDTNEAAPAVSNTMTVAVTKWRPMDFLSVGLFGSVMGLTGLAIAWRLAQAQFGAPTWPATALGGVACIDFIALAIAYATKLFSSPMRFGPSLGTPSLETCLQRP